MTRGPLRIANCSGFFGDRPSAAREALDGGPIDVLTGDWLAELTMGVLAKQRARADDTGYARTFLSQMEDVLADCLDRGIKVVSNAGGLNPAACAAEVERIAARSGRRVTVAVVDGDDATEAFSTALLRGWEALHLDSGEPFGDQTPLAVNAYLGGWGIAEALEAGADVVVTGRVTDAAIILGPAAWHFGWERTDWDALAGAVAAGHVIECGAQGTGGNFSFFSELEGLDHTGFPIAEISADGSSVITKHPGTGGAVTVETLTAQLLYEIDGPAYANPDVVCRLDTVQLEQEGPDRVRIVGVRGEPAPAEVKVGAIVSGGWRNEITFVITGREVAAKAALAEAALWARVPGGRDAFDRVSVQLLRAGESDPPTMERSVSLLRIAVADADRAAVQRFPRAAIETGLASYPGLYFTTPPAPASEITVFWPTLMRAESFPQRVTFSDGRTIDVPVSRTSGDGAPVVGPQPPAAQTPTAQTPAGPVSRRPLGSVFGARSGDKAGNATLGLWARNDPAHRWLRSWWNEDAIRSLVPESRDCALRLWELPHLRACGVTIVGLLGRGVAANLELDSQGKGLAEYVRAKTVEIPDALVEQAGFDASSGAAS